MSVAAVLPMLRWPWSSAREPVWEQTMSCTDVLMAHWEFYPHILRRVLPAGLELDTRYGVAWLSVVAFTREDHVHGCVSGASASDLYPELDLLTYVTRDGKPGVWFLSLDTLPRLPIAAARARLHLPYVHAWMRSYRTGGRVRYDSERDDPYMGRGNFAGFYWPTGEAFTAHAESLDAWLTERPFLYSTDHRGRLLRGQIVHVPPMLRPAAADIELNTLAEAHGFELPDDPLLRFIDRVEITRRRAEPCG